MRTNAFMAFSILGSTMGVYSMRMYIEHKRWFFMVYAGLLISGAAFMAALAVSTHE
jgi:hypothetical protein